MFQSIDPRQERQPNPDIVEKAILAMQEGDRHAIQTLYTQCASSVFAYAFSIVKNHHDAEDILHDCFVRIWEHAESYQSHGKPMAWLITITKNLCLTRLREQKRHGDLMEQDAVAAETEEPDRRILLESYLSELSEQEREIVVLHVVSGMKHREIAALLKIPIGTALSKYRRAINKLRIRMEEDGENV